MLDNTRSDGPLCIKCKQPTSFHSAEIVHSKAGNETVAIFHCDRCNLLSAQSTGTDTPPRLSRAS